VSTLQLAASIDSGAETITLTDVVGLREGMLLQAGKEVIVVDTISEAGCEVQRGAYGTEEEAHDAGSAVYPLERRTSVMPFVKGFFGSSASGSYGHAVTLPNVRIVVAELFVTNVRGNSEVTGVSYAHLKGGGIRTLTGGQITLQVEGALAIQSDAVPPIASDARRAVRDVFGTLTTPPTGGEVQVRVKAGGQDYCVLTFAAGESDSDVIDGSALPALNPKAPVGLEILSIPQGGNTSSGAGLTVTIRF
jgi:hypothetical protein